MGECARYRLTVVEAYLPGTLRGLYVPAEGRIYLRAGMPGWAAVPTLMHELYHVERGDAGHQGRGVEARIDRQVACRLLDVGRYAAAEAVAGPAVGALAAELEVPTWVVVAYQDALRRAGRRERDAPGA